MVDKDKIATYYSNARELIKQNNPKAARAYVLAILNCALQTYKKASTILVKAKTQAFLDKWIAVSRDLYAYGVTDYVLECFGLPTKAEANLPKVKKTPKTPEPKASAPKATPKSPAPKEPAKQKPFLPAREGEIDISGLVDEASQEQGWCAKIFEQNKTSVVEISVSNGAKSASGTGFVISKNGYILTNDHVVFDEDGDCYYNKVKMSFVGDKKSYKLTILFSDKKADVALCSFDPQEAPNFTAIKLVADYSKVLQGADCLVIGNAFGMGLAPFTGVVRFTKNDEGDLVYTAPSNPGDSGGPVLNRQGECIGINKSKTVSVNHVTADGYANATPMDAIVGLLDKWCKNNNITL